jgi:hypothetical protein
MLRTLTPLLLLALSGCSAFMSKGDSNPAEEALASGTQLQTIVLFSTSGLQGSLLPPSPNQGGAALVESYFKIAKQDLGSRVVWLDSGNVRGKSGQVGYDQNQSFETFLAQSGMSVTLDGSPHASASAPVSEPTPNPSQHPSYRELPRDSASHLLVPVSLQTGSLRVGVISAKTPEEISRQSREARAEGAQLVVWLSDSPIRCNPHLTKAGPLFRKPGDSDGFCDGPLSEILMHLPAGTLDAVLTSGTDRPVNHFIYPMFSADPAAAVPVVASAPFGKTIALIYLTYDLQNHKLLGAKTRIEGPVPVCGKIFKNQSDCDEERPAPELGRGSLTRSRFHGRTVEPDVDVEKLATAAEAWMEAQNQIVVAQSTTELSVNPRGESSFGDLLADAIREETHSDFALVNPGLIKHAVGHASFRIGAVSAGMIDRAIPVDAPIDIIRVSGEELKTLVRISETGLRGFASVSGMKLKLIRPDREAPVSDLTGAQKRVSWELNRLVAMNDPDGDSISTRRTFRVAIPEYLVMGGDDWKWVSRHLDLPRRTEPASAPSARQLLTAYLKRVGKIDSVPARIQFVEPKSRASGKHSRRRRRRKTAH